MAYPGAGSREQEGSGLGLLDYLTGLAKPRPGRPLSWAERNVGFVPGTGMQREPATSYESAINKVPYDPEQLRQSFSGNLSPGSGVLLPPGMPGSPGTKYGTKEWHERFDPAPPAIETNRPAKEPPPKIERPAPTESTMRAIRMPNGTFLFTNRDELGGDEVVGGPAAAGREIRAIDRPYDSELRNPVTASTSDLPGALVRASQDQAMREGEDSGYRAQTRHVAGITPSIFGGGYSRIEGTPEQQAEINFRNKMDEVMLENANQELAAAKMGEGGGFAYDPSTGRYVYNAPAFPYRTHAIDNLLRQYESQRAIDREDLAQRQRDYGAQEQQLTDAFEAAKQRILTAPGYSDRERHDELAGLEAQHEKDLANLAIRSGFKEKGASEALRTPTTTLRVGR